MKKKNRRENTLGISDAFLTTPLPPNFLARTQRFVGSFRAQWTVQWTSDFEETW